MVQENDMLALMRQTEFFQGIGPADLQLIAPQMTEQFYAEGELLFREGDPGGCMYLLLEGVMHVYVEREGKIVTFAKLQAGEFFWEMALVEDAPRSATIRADAPSHCLTLSKQGCFDLLNGHPLIALGILKTLFPRLRRSPPERGGNPRSP